MSTAHPGKPRAMIFDGSYLDLGINLGVIPILIGPMQVLLAILPAIGVALFGILASMLKPAVMLTALKVAWRNKVAMTAVLLVAVGLVYGYQHLPSFGRTAGATFAGSAEWPMFRGGLSRRGAQADGKEDPLAGGQVWAFASPFATFYSSPTVVGNRILASAADKGVFADRGGIFCLDAESGATVWSFSPRDFRATFSSPTVSPDGRYVVCGEGLHETRDSRVFCLSFASGEKLWEVRTASHVEASACIADGLAVCGAGADGIYGLRLDTPAGGNPVVWHVAATADQKATFHCDASPAISEGKAYVSTAALHGKDMNGVVCLEAATGKELWLLPAPLPVWAPPTISNGRMYVGMGNGNFIESAEQVWARKQKELQAAGVPAEEITALAPRYAPGGRLWCIDLATRRILWERPLAQTLLGAVAEVDGQLYFAARDGLVTCLDAADGTLISQWDAKDGVVASPAVGKGHLYIVTESGRLVGLERRNLEPVWEARLGNGSMYFSSPALGCGHIYVGTPSGGLVCMGVAGKPVPPLWAGWLGGPGRGGYVDGGQIPERGVLAWRWPEVTAEAEGGSASVIAAPAAADGGLIFVPVATPGRCGLAALAPPGQGAGGKTARKPEQRWFLPTAKPLRGTVAASAGMVYAIDGAPGEAGRRLYAVDAGSGTEVWHTEIEASASGEFTLTHAGLLLGRDGRSLSCLETGRGGGRTMWTASTGAMVGAPAACGEAILVAVADPPGVLALRPQDGAELWRQTLPAAPIGGLVGGPDVAVLPSDGGLLGLSLANGGVLWSLPDRPARQPVAAGKEQFAFATAAGEIVIADWRGKAVQRWQGGGAPMLAGKLVLFQGGGGLQRADIASGQVTRWLATDWLGELSAPPVLVDGRIYFPTQAKGLVCAEGKTR